MMMMLRHTSCIIFYKNQGFPTTNKNSAKLLISLESSAEISRKLKVIKFWKLPQEFGVWRKNSGNSQKILKPNVA